MRTLVLVCHLAVLGACSVGPEVEISRSAGALSPNLVSCERDAGCASGSACVNYQVVDGGHYCGLADDPCSALSCGSASEGCYCLFTQPMICGCASRAR